MIVTMQYDKTYLISTNTLHMRCFKLLTILSWQLNHSNFDTIVSKLAKKNDVSRNFRINWKIINQALNQDSTQIILHGPTA